MWRPVISLHLVGNVLPKGSRDPQAKQSHHILCGVSKPGPFGCHGEWQASICPSSPAYLTSLLISPSSSSSHNSHGAAPRSLSINVGCDNQTYRETLLFFAFLASFPFFSFPLFLFFLKTTRKFKLVSSSIGQKDLFIHTYILHTHTHTCVFDSVLSSLWGILHGAAPPIGEGIVYPPESFVDRVGSLGQILRGGYAYINSL